MLFFRGYGQIFLYYGKDTRYTGTVCIYVYFALDIVSKLDFTWQGALYSLGFQWFVVY